MSHQEGQEAWVSNGYESQVFVGEEVLGCDVAPAFEVADLCGMRWDGYFMMDDVVGEGVKVVHVVFEVDW